MTDPYKRVMRSTGIVAAVVSAGWIVAASMSRISDDVALSREINTAAAIIIVCSTLVAAGAWIVEHSHRDASRRYIRPLVRQELDRAFAENMPLFVSSVVESLERRIVEHMHEVAEASGKQAAVRFRDLVTEDLREILGDFHKRALITGQRLQAAATGQAVGKVALRSIQFYNTDDN